ncbi:MAG TPA: hypothetical protein VGC24_06650 [Burkholderiaceae bacterium]
MAVAVWCAASVVFAGPNGSGAGASSKATIDDETFTVTGTQTTAATGECSRVSVTVTGQVTGTTDDGGGTDTIYVTLWDDDVQKAVATVSVPVGVTQTINVTLGFAGLYATGAPGIGVYVGESAGDGSLYVVDPFYPADITGSCSAATPVPAMSLTGLLGTGALVGLGALGGLRRRQYGSTTGDSSV